MSPISIKLISYSARACFGNIKHVFLMRKYIASDTAYFDVEVADLLSVVALAALRKLDDQRPRREQSAQGILNSKQRFLQESKSDGI